MYKINHQKANLLENVKLRNHGKENGKAPQNGEHGQTESLGAAQPTNEIAHKEQRKGKDLLMEREKNEFKMKK